MDSVLHKMYLLGGQVVGVLGHQLVGQLPEVAVEVLGLCKGAVQGE